MFILWGAGVCSLNAVIILQEFCVASITSGISFRGCLTAKFKGLPATTLDDASSGDHEHLQWHLRCSCHLISRELVVDQSVWTRIHFDLQVASEQSLEGHHMKWFILWGPWIYTMTSKIRWIISRFIVVYQVLDRYNFWANGCFRGLPKSLLWIILWGSWISPVNFIAVWSISVDIETNLTEILMPLVISNWTPLFLRSVIFHVVSPLLLVVCVGEVVKLGRGMWMRPTMLGWSSATFSSSFSSSSSSPLSHVLLSDGYSYVLARLDSLKEILSCKRHRGRIIRTSSHLSSLTCYRTALIRRYCLFTKSLTDCWFPLPPYLIFTLNCLCKENIGRCSGFGEIIWCSFKSSWPENKEKENRRYGSFLMGTIIFTERLIFRFGQLRQGWFEHFWGPRRVSTATVNSK